MAEKRPAEGEAEGKKEKKQCFTVNASIIKIIIGKLKITNLIHESILSMCPFFEKCLNSGMREQEEKTVNLPEDDPRAFTVIAKWLYAETVAKDLDNWVLASAYVATNKYCVPKLQNAIVDLFRGNRQKFRRINPKLVVEIWNTTVDGSPPRQLALDQLRFDLTKYRLRKLEELVENSYGSKLRGLMKNDELGMALVLHFTDGDGWKALNSSELIGCCYHVHQGREKCGK